MIEYVDMVVGGMVGAWENTFCAVLIGIGQASIGFYSIAIGQTAVLIGIGQTAVLIGIGQTAVLIGIGQAAVLIGIGQASFIYMYWHVCQQKEMVVVAIED